MIDNDPNERRFICVYQTIIDALSSTFHPYYETKAVMVFDRVDRPELPFGFDPDHLGPDEDPVARICCLIDVTDQPNPRVVIDEAEWSFDLTGAPIREAT